MSDRRRFPKGLTSVPLATVLASLRLAAAVTAGLQAVEAKAALVFNAISGAPTYPISSGNHMATDSSTFPSRPD